MISTGLHPIILIAVIGALLGAVALTIVFVARSRLVKALVGVLALICFVPAAFVFLAFHPQLVDSRFRTYKEFYSDIKIGMTRDEVFTLIDKHYPKSGPRQQPTILADTAKALEFFMHPETSTEPNCEGIFLELDK